jgi:hypothetical protein
MTKTRRMILLSVPVVALLMLVGPAAAQAGSVCGSNWCSGDDGATTHNIQGNTPQVYIGQVDSYTHNFGAHSAGPCPAGLNDDMCFVSKGADDAASRWRSGGGIGVQSYYFGGGAVSMIKPSGDTPYCWGADQGFDALWDLRNVSGFDYHNQQRLMFLDVDDPVTMWGWSSGYTGEDRAVLNGFEDYITGKNPCGRGDPSNHQQPGAYGSPDGWGTAMGAHGYIPNTYVWTTQNCCDLNTWPGANWGGSNNVTFFGGSNHRWGRQFGYNSNGGNDYDDAYAPDYLPALNETIGR